MVGNRSNNINERMVTMVKFSKAVAVLFLGVLFVMALAPVAMAAESASSGAVDYTKAIVIGCSLVAAGFSIGLGANGTGQGMGTATSGSTSAVGRNPEAQGKIMLTMMVGMAMAESVAIYALVVSLIILYANPLLKYIAG